jgi:hypothetical protein
LERSAGDGSLEPDGQPLSEADRMLQSARESVARFASDFGAELGAGERTFISSGGPPEAMGTLRIPSTRLHELGWVGLEPVSKRYETSALVMHVYYLPIISYCLHVAGRHLVDIYVTGTYPKLEHDLQISVQIAPDFSEVCQRTLPAPEPGIESHVGFIPLLLCRDRLRQIRETQPGSLKIQIADPNGHVLLSAEESVDVVAFNHWLSIPGRPDLLATFVLSNDPALGKVLPPTSARLEATTGSDALDGYQSSQPDSTGMPRTYRIAEAIYDTLRDDFDLGYISPPPSFETNGQKVVLPEELLRTRMGTCLDLALLYAACLERVDLHPVLFLMQGHAFAGMFTVPISLPEPSTHSWLAVSRHVADGSLVPVETTGMTRGLSFEDAVQSAMNTLQGGSAVEIAVDVVLAHRAGAGSLTDGNAGGYVG